VRFEFLKIVIRKALIVSGQFRKAFLDIDRAENVVLQWRVYRRHLFEVNR
jgi:hypothetical protein